MSKNDIVYLEAKEGREAAGMRKDSAVRKQSKERHTFLPVLRKRAESC